MYRASVLAALGLVVALSQPSPAHGEALTLIENGEARAIIVTARMPETPDRRLVSTSRELLVGSIQRMTGVELEVVRESNLEARVLDGHVVPSAGSVDADIDTFILVGEGELAQQLGVTNDQVGRGGVRIKTTTNAVVLTGPFDGWAYRGGTVYATYQFLEALGFRYLWPGDLGLVIPEADTVRVEPMDVSYTPPIGQRNIRTMARGPRRHDRGLEALGFTEEDYAAQRESVRTYVRDTSHRQGWSAWQGLGGSLGIHGGHSSKGLRDAEEQLEKNPEWFALQADGTRDRGGESRLRLCVSNEDLIEHVAQSVIERVNESPRSSISLAPSDGGRASFCLCEDCRALDPEDAPKVNHRIFEEAGSSSRETVEYHSLTDRHIWYWNQIAERVTEVHPDLLFVVDAYSVYATPPVRERPHPNLVIRYVPGDREGWEQWREAGAERIFWRPNTLHSGYRQGTLNRQRAREIADLISFFGQHGMEAIDIQGIYNNWSTQGLNYYVAARFIWDPSQDYDELLDDYARKGFGPAAEPIKAYFTMLDDLGSSLRRDYTPDVIAELRGHLDEAMSAASGEDTIRERIRFLRVGLEFTAMTAKAMQKVHAIENDERTVDKELGQKALDRRWALMQHIFKNYPMAVNVALVEGNNVRDTRAWNRVLDWSGPTDAAAQALDGEVDDAALDAWLYEDQTVLPD